MPNSVIEIELVEEEEGQLFFEGSFVPLALVFKVFIRVAYLI
jgi:hypothetical protein